MAKKKKPSRAEQVRDAAEQAFKAQIPRERISELIDELGSTAGRLRGAVDELRPASEAELKSLRAEVHALLKRVEALEARPNPNPKPAPRRRAAAKPAAAKSAAAKPAAAKPAAAKPAASRARKPPAKPPAAGS